MAPPQADDSKIYNAKLISEKLSKVEIGSVEIPEPFIVAPKDRATISHDSWAEVPLLDFSEAETDEAGLARKLVEAVSHCGFFSFINHGVPMELIERIQAEGHNFFTLAFEEKQKIGLTERLMGYSGDFRNKFLDQLLWNEALQMDLRTTQPEDFAQKVWPEGDPKFSATIREYGAAVRKTQHDIFQLLAVGLGLPRDFFAKHFSPEAAARQTMRWNYYPTCPKPMEVIGAPGHTDTVTMTILHDGEVGGLQIMMNGEWKGIKPVTGALICNAGDILRLWSNDTLKSALHRVVVNESKPRMSTAVFVNPSRSAVISVPSSLAQDIGQPRRYKSFTLDDFLKAYHEVLASKKVISGLEFMMSIFASKTGDESAEKSNRANVSV
ncbi:hypothetical protein Mapa_008437 [Marchantia paleacea]|nr:hypothetical protein Mapa_008437 [Marchantia paleacea]